MLGGEDMMARPRVILVLRECIFNAPAVSFVLTTFDGTGFLPQRVRWSIRGTSWFHPGGETNKEKNTEN